MVTMFATAIDLLPPRWLVLAAVAAVWLYEGPVVQVAARRSAAVRESSPPCRGSDARSSACRSCSGSGCVEVLLAGWVLLGVACRSRALMAQTVLLVALNTNGLLWARHLIHDPAGMVVKNAALLVTLAWVGASCRGAGVTAKHRGLGCTGASTVVGGRGRCCSGRVYEDAAIESAAPSGRAAGA
jgi:hypothetical protein